MKHHLPSCRRRRSFSAWWGRWKPRLSMQFSLRRCWAPQHHYPRVLPRRVELCPKSLISATTKTWKYMKIVWVRVYQRKQPHHHATSGTVHVDSCIRCIWRSYQPARAVHVHLCPLEFLFILIFKHGRKMPETPKSSMLCAASTGQDFRHDHWSGKDQLWCNLNIQPNSSTKGLLQLTRLYLFDPVCWFTVNLEILTLGRTHAYVVPGGSWMQFVWCRKASKEEQLMTPIASAPNLSCCSNLYKLHHTSWNPSESTWNLTPKHKKWTKIYTPKLIFKNQSQTIWMFP